MSYSQEIKTEMMKNRLLKTRDRDAFLCGLVLFSKTLRNDGVVFSEQRALATLYASLVTKAYGNKADILENAVKDRTLYTVVFRDAIPEMPDEIPAEITENPEKLGAFFSGVYLACGSVTNPEREYHLEFAVHTEALAEALCGAFRTVEIEPKVTKRRGDWLVYIKESEQIEEVLTRMSAPVGAMEMMSTKIYKDVRNKANRIANCEIANINKTVEAAGRQAEDIRFIVQYYGEQAIPEELRELAYLRVDNPDLSLKELGEQLSVPMSRSGVHHRLERLQKIAETLRGGDDLG